MFLPLSPPQCHLDLPAGTSKMPSPKPGWFLNDNKQNQTIVWFSFLKSQASFKSKQLQFLFWMKRKTAVTALSWLKAMNLKRFSGNLEFIRERHFSCISAAITSDSKAEKKPNFDPCIAQTPRLATKAYRNPFFWSTKQVLKFPFLP